MIIHQQLTGKKITSLLSPPVIILFGSTTDLAYFHLLGSNCSHFYVYSRDSRPKLRLYVSEYNGASINVSPDGTRFSFDLNENSFTLYEITGYRAPGPEDMDEDEAEDEDEEVTEIDRWFQGSNIDRNRFSKKLSTITVINNKKTQSTIGQTEGDEGSTL